ncbi:MAG TPA: head GIN domain-containing protein [Panacibacter sp.]|nr:head GIN domain-containing protein [Panacibacter sp.]HNP44049.1 head GIN domain-containing protein [Panacibacter sp.]
MKKITLLSLVALSFTIAATAQKKKLAPSGNIVTKNIAVQAFNAIEAAGIYELVLTQGDKEAVRIEADDNMQELFSVTNEGSTLVISMPKLDDQEINIDGQGDHDKKLRWKVYVSYKSLKRLELSVIGNIRGENALKSDAFEIKNKAIGNIDLKISTAKLTVRNEGVGKIILAGDATNAVIKNSGVGELDGEDLLVQTMDIDNSGVGHASVNVQKDLTVQQSFLGKVTNVGNGKKHVKEGEEI